MSGPAPMWDSDKVFRRILSLLLPFYAAALILLQTRPELFHFSSPAPSRIEPPRIARILPSPRSGRPLQVKEPPAVQKTSVSPASPLLPASQEAGPPPVQKADRKVSLPPPSAGSASGGKGVAASATSREGQMKKVGILGLLGEGKAPAGKGFASLKEIPPTAGKGDKKGGLLSTLPESEIDGKGDKKGGLLSTLSESEIETIHHKTVATEEQRLAHGRREVIEANLSQPKIIQEGFAAGQQTIHDIVYQNKEKLLVLYNRRLIGNPNVQGNITLEFIISPRGRVIKCYILDSSLSDPPFEKEIIEEIMAWTFPAVEKGETTVLYPLAFFPAG